MSARPPLLPEDIGMYVDSLRARCESIDEVWLIGPHANDRRSREATWDLLAFADAAALRTVRAESEWHLRNVNLYIVTDGNRFERAWGEPGRGALADLQWRLEDPESATYVPRDSGSDRESARSKAIRVR